MSPMEYAEAVIGLCGERRGAQLDFKALEGNRTVMRFRLPLAEIVVDFFSKLKAITSGYASFDYEDAGFVDADVVKVNVTLNGRVVEEFSAVLPYSSSRSLAKEMVGRLKEEIPRQQFDVDIVAQIGGKTIAKGKIKAFRKDFTQKLKGNFGDPTRLAKLVSHQQEGKKRLKSINNVQIPKEAFINVLKR